MLNTQVHSHLQDNMEKTSNTVSYFASKALERFSKTSDWNLEVWLDEEGVTHEGRVVTCGVALRRPRRSTIYIKKVGENLRDAIKQCVDVLEDNVSAERRFWNRGYKHILGKI